MKLAFSSQDIKLIQAFMSEKITGDKAMPGRLIFKKLHKELSLKLDESQFCLLLSAAVRGGNVEGFEGRRKVGYIVSGSRPPTKSQLANEENEEKTETLPAPPQIDPQADTDPAPPPLPPPTKEELDKLAAEREAIAAEKESIVVERQELETARNELAAERDGFEKAKLSEREAVASERRTIETEREKLRAERKSFEESKRMPVSVPRTDAPEQAWKRAQRLTVVVGRHSYDVPMAAYDVRALLDQVLQATQADDGPIEFNGKRYSCDNMQLLERLLLCFFESTMIVGAREAAA